MICAVILVTYIPWVIFLTTGWKWLKSLALSIQILVWIAFCTIEFASIVIYPEWGVSLDARAWSYLHHPNEAWASSKDFVGLGQLFLFLVFLISGYKNLLFKFENWKPIRSYYAQSIFLVLLVGGLGFLGLRGGWQKLPIVPSDAFYSNNMTDNFTAVNKSWYFTYSMIKSNQLTQYCDDIAIDSFIAEYTLNNNQIYIDSAQWAGKNIVLVVLEGWSEDMVKYLASKENIAPFFDSLSSHSIQATNAFSTGFRTDQGMMSVQSGMPSIQSINMPNVLDKVQKYPSLCNEMKRAGYYTSFIYGGDLNFANLYNYLSFQGYDTIISQKDFEGDDLMTSWGVPDHITVAKASQILNNQKGKFFSTVLLLSSHSPFEIPIPNDIKGEEIASKYKASVKYSDESLRQFFSKIKTSAWYSNTVFIITSDHGSTHSGHAGMEDHKRFRIPYIIYQPWLETDIELDVPFNHFDTPATILAQIGVKSNTMPFSRNIFAKDSTRSAYWNIDNACGSYSLHSQDIINTIATNKSQPCREKSFLFFETVKRYYTSLSN